MTLQLLRGLGKERGRTYPHVLKNESNIKRSRKKYKSLKQKQHIRSRSIQVDLAEKSIFEKLSKWIIRSLTVKSFSESDTYTRIEEQKVKPEEAKNTVQTLTKAATEFSQNRKETSDALQDTKQQGTASKKLWKEGSNSRLIQIGTTLILLPEPTPISIIVGSGFVAAGTIQKGIKNQSLYMEDIPKTLKSAFKEIQNQRASLKL